MFSVMGFMLAGIFIGYFLKQQKKLFKIIGKLNMWIIFLLLFSMGLSIGNNKSIIESLDHFGITAIIIGLALPAVYCYLYLFINFYLKDNLINEKQFHHFMLFYYRHLISILSIRSGHIPDI